MKVIVAGSRKITDKNKVFKCISDGIAEVANSLINNIEIVSGGALGVDSIAKDWATTFNISFNLFLADWDKYGKKAGYIRNNSMADYVGKEGILIAIWDKKSRGTKMMIDIAKKKGLKVFVYAIN